MRACRCEYRHRAGGRALVRAGIAVALILGGCGRVPSPVRGARDSDPPPARGGADAGAPGEDAAGGAAAPPPPAPPDGPAPHGPNGAGSDAATPIDGGRDARERLEDASDALSPSPQDRRDAEAADASVACDLGPPVGLTVGTALHAYARGSNGGLVAYARGSSGWTASPGRPEGIVGQPVPVATASGAIEVFVRVKGADGKESIRVIRHAPGQPLGASESLGAPPGGSVGEPAVEPWWENALALFVLDGAGALWTRWQTKEGAWTAWSKIGGPVVVPLVGPLLISPSFNGRFQVFSPDEDGFLRIAWQMNRVDPASAWSDWRDLGTPLGRPSGLALVLARTDEMHVFASATGGRLWTTFQLGTGGNWSPWLALADRVVGAPAAVVTRSRVIQVFAVGDDGRPRTRIQAGMAGTGVVWTEVGGAIELLPGLTAVLGPDNAPVVFGRGRDCTPVASAQAPDQGTAGTSFGAWEALSH